MSFDRILPLPDFSEESSKFPLARYSQVHLKSEGEKILLILPTSSQKEEMQDWGQTWQELKYCLKSNDRAWQKGTAAYLVAQDRLLDGRQLSAIAQTLKEADLQLKCVRTSRRQTAVAAATAGYSVEQETQTQPFPVSANEVASLLAEPLYLKTTLRSGSTIRHPGTVIVLGDVNPGGEILADGDIIVWGNLRGVAHAGAKGDRECRIMALRMEPTQLRIADVVARAPALASKEFDPEVAYMTAQGIRITGAINFSKTYTFVPKVKGWVEKEMGSRGVGESGSREVGK
jgi:septum site-determining protein MinC